MLTGYADLSGINENNNDIKNFEPFINFKWGDKLETNENESFANFNKQINVFSKYDLKVTNTQLNVMCYRGTINNIKSLKDIYNKGYRVVRIYDYIKITKSNVKILNDSKLIIDTYGMSEKNLKKFLKYTIKPACLSIGNSSTISKNKNNAKDANIKAIKELNGVVGINISREHLNTTVGRYDSFEYIFRHIDYLIDLIGEDNLCFSVGFDNQSIYPWEVNKLGDVKVVENWLKVFYGKGTAEKIMWKNAYDFLERSL